MAYINRVRVYQAELSATYLSRLVQMQRAYNEARVDKREKGDILCQIIGKPRTRVSKDTDRTVLCRLC